MQLPLTKRFFSLLALPVAIEILNVVMHNVLRPASDYLHWLDIVSTGISACVVFFVGWTVARALNRFMWAMVGALIIWMCSVLAVILVWAVELLFVGTLTETHLLGMKGFLLSTVFSFAVVSIVAAIAAAIAMRTHRPEV